MSPRLDGIDISHYQGAGFPWTATVAHHGLTLGACKMTEGAAYVDPTGHENRAAMHATPLRWIGLYHFARAGDIRAQVDNFVRQVGELRDREFFMLDVEAPMTASRPDIIAVLKAFETRYPGRVVRYQGMYFAEAQHADYAPWPWWLPAYRATCPQTRMPVALWQWAGGANGVTVPGVGQVDSNQVLDAATLDRVCAIHSPAPTPPVPPPLYDEDEDMLDGFVKDDADGTFWARGVDEVGQWACPIEELGVAWELYQIPLDDRPHDSLVAHHRRPVATSGGPVNLDALAKAVADELAARLLA